MNSVSRPGCPSGKITGNVEDDEEKMSTEENPEY
jgi:hypothetical protein